MKPPRITGRMTIDEIATDLRARNCSIGKDVLCNLICDGTFPIGKVVSVSGSGRRNILVLANDYYAWADEQVGPYVEVKQYAVQ